MTQDWRKAKSLITLTNQLNALYGKNRKPDEAIGDDRHRAESFSDHNPNSAGVVRAIDIYPAKGLLGHPLDLDELAATLLHNKDARIKYVIFNRRLFSSPGYTTKYPPWVWRKYTGTDPHTGHVHVSVLGTPAKPIYDDTKPWDLIPTLEPPITVIVHDHPPPLDHPAPPAPRDSWWVTLLKRWLG